MKQERERVRAKWIRRGGQKDYHQEEMNSPPFMVFIDVHIL